MRVDGDAMTIDTEAAGPDEPLGNVQPGRFERFLAVLGDRLNAILVKETRQALKSRQFVTTFGLLLLCGWIWSLAGVAIIGPAIDYGTHGPWMFFGYYLILAFPLLVVVPYGAFRSVAAEQEERTYEMLSITALGPRQIVWGKLGSAALQMLIFLSAITPCLAFTYLLRGISLPTILLIFFYTGLGSLSLSMVGLFLGTLTTEKYFQVIISVLAAVGLFLAFWGGCVLVQEILRAEEMLQLSDAWFHQEFWIGNAAVVTLVVSYFALVFEAAAARITFAADNRSSRLRIVMLAQFALFTGWMAWGWIISGGYHEILWTYLIVAGLHWYGMGAMIIGESPDLSLRVRRHLPRSMFGRVFLTWFNPGPGTGYMFAIAGLLGTLTLAVVALELLPVWPAGQSPSPAQSYVNARWFAAMGLCYVVFFLGLGLLLNRAVRKFSRVGVTTAVLLQVLLVVLFCGIPAIVHSMTWEPHRSSYSAVEVASPIWTLAYIGQRGMPVKEKSLIVVLVPLAALVVFLLNLPGVVRELRFVRIAAPKRVMEEDAELAAQKVPPRPTRTSPWDD